MTTIDELRTHAAALATARSDAIRASASSAASADAAAAAARAAAAVGDPAAVASAAKEESAARQASQQRLVALSDLDTQLAGLVAQLAGDPCDLESDVPLALLPVRLETRYTAGGTTLRVRIYPDDVHVDRLDRGLSADELVAGKAYWTAVWSGALTEDGAWHALIDAVGANRAPWVTAALTPDLANRPTPPGPVPTPVFPEPGPLHQRPAVARGLPDRFVVTVYQGTQSSRAVGNPVPAELVVGLPPGADPSQMIQHGNIVLGPDMTWLVDPAEAQRVGMLVDVTLAVAGAPVDRVIAVGVRAALDPTAAAEALRALFEGHRYTAGAAVVAPGTPTNNTETDRSAWTRHPAPTPPATRPASPVDPGSDAAVLATALGLDPSSMPFGSSAVPAGGGPPGQALAQAANTALWQCTWGTFIDRVLVTTGAGANIDDATREAWRDYWQDHVRGRGPLPLVQVGDQPYGVLPASAMKSRWHADPTSAFEGSLLSLLRNIRRIVSAGVENVNHVAGSASLDDALLDILGSAPHELGLRVRSLTSATLASYTRSLLGLAPTNEATQAVLHTVLWTQLGFEAAHVGHPGTTSQKTKPLGLPLVDDNDSAYLGALLADQPRSVTSVLQALLEISAGREKAAIAAAAPPDGARALLDKGAQEAGRLTQTLAQLTEATLAGRADPARLDSVARDLGQRFGVAGPSALAVEQPIVSLRTNLAQRALSAAVGTHALSVLGAWFRAQARWAGWQEAAKLLVKATTSDRGLVVAETLDCASHRYDAWVSALPTRRLGQVRAAHPTGVLLGAFGWVENLVPGAATTRPGGFVHAPSLTHAATAGVLRSGYLTHNPDTAAGGALALDLSSARVRRALNLLDGVRQGQPLGALLGYQIERRLHENGLDRFSLSLRALAPVVAGQLTGRADAVPDQAKEALSANNVVDGVRLLALPVDQVLAALANKPHNIYLDHPALPPWVGPDPGQSTLIQAILVEAADSYHGVSDVLLAESVHQLVQGNTARAAAVMDAAAGGDAAPVDPDVVRSPSRAAALTQRVVVLVGDTPAGSGGWSATTPRAIAEPRLAAWAEARLGPASNVVVQVAAGGTTTMLDAASLSALDLVFDSADPALLERRVRAALPLLASGPLAAVRDPAWPVGQMAFGELATMAAGLLRVIGGSKALAPAALARPNDIPTRVVDTTGLVARVSGVVDGLSGAITTLSAAMAASPPDPGQLAVAVDALRAYGVSLPAGGELVAQASLAEAIRRRRAAMDALAAPAAAAPAAAGAPPQADPPPAAAVVPLEARQAQAAGEAVFGTGFLVLPLIGPSAGATDLYAATFGAVDPGTTRLRRWLRDLSPVRPAVARYAETLLFADARVGVGAGPRLTVAQLAATGTAGAGSWLGTVPPAPSASPDQPVTDIVLETPAGYDPSRPVAGLVVDEWVEQLPRRDADGVARVTTGVAINANAPNCRAPQAVLLAVSPDGSRWTTDGLLDVLTETLELAKMRLATLERIPLIGRVLPAIQEQSWSLQGEETIDLRLLMTQMASEKFMLPYVKETGA